jgi:hypothetical protein
MRVTPILVVSRTRANILFCECTNQGSPDVQGYLSGINYNCMNRLLNQQWLSMDLRGALDSEHFGTQLSLAHAPNPTQEGGR